MEENKNKNHEENTKNNNANQDNSSKNQNFSSNDKEQTEQKPRVVPFEDYIKLKYQLADVINKYKEFEHEFNNYRTRTKDEIKQAQMDGMTKGISVVFPAMDSFKKAKKLIKDENSLNGIKMIEKSILDALKKHGIKKIECIGEKFDPNIHNAVLLVEDKTKESGTIIDELEAGYTFNDKVVKFSQVIVAK